MTEKKTNKTQIINEYLTKNPGHTWKRAQKELEKHDITSTYFAAIKGKLKAKGGGKKRKVTRQPRAAKLEVGANLEGALQFARSAGGIDDAIRLLETVKRLQV